jgi:hypothetical protein
VKKLVTLLRMCRLLPKQLWYVVADNVVGDVDVDGDDVEEFVYRFRELNVVDNNLE